MSFGQYNDLPAAIADMNSGDSHLARGPERAVNEERLCKFDTDAAIGGFCTLSSSPIIIQYVEVDRPNRRQNSDFHQFIMKFIPPVMHVCIRQAISDHSHGWSSSGHLVMVPDCL